VCNYDTQKCVTKNWPGTDECTWNSQCEPQEFDITIDVRNDKNNDGNLSGDRLPSSTVDDIDYRFKEDDSDPWGVWVDTGSSLNPQSLTSLLTGYYQFRILFKQVCPNDYAQGTKWQISGSAVGNYTVAGGYYITGSFQLSSNSILYLGGWEPWDAKSISGTFWVDSNCAEAGGDMVPYDAGKSVDVEASYNFRGTPATIVDSTSNGEYSLGGIKVSYCGSTAVYLGNTPLEDWYSVMEPAPRNQSLTYSGVDLSNINFYVCYEPPDWMQGLRGNVFAQTISIPIPLGISLTDRIPFASDNTEIMCDPGSASSVYGSGIYDYGDYNYGGLRQFLNIKLSVGAIRVKGWLM
jgi:hypothetical protein